MWLHNYKDHLVEVYVLIDVKLELLGPILQMRETRILIQQCSQNIRLCATQQGVLMLNCLCTYSDEWTLEVHVIDRNELDLRVIGVESWEDMVQQYRFFFYLLQS